MHPNAVIAVAAAAPFSKELTREIYGEEVGWTPWLRPGFELGLRNPAFRQAAAKAKADPVGSTA